MSGNTGAKNIVERITTADDTFEKSHRSGIHPLYQRVVVFEVLFDPAALTDGKLDELKSQIRFSSNIRNLPQNTIVGQRINTGATEINSLELFFPFFSPHFCLPVKPGEQVWVMFEDGNLSDTQGFWMSRISEIRTVDDVNHTHADRKFDRRASTKTADKVAGGPPLVPDFNNGLIGSLDGVTVNAKGTSSISGGPDAYKNIIKGKGGIKPAAAVSVHDFEQVPRLRKRPGDLALQGSNNTLVLLTTDRTGAAAVTKDGTPFKRPDSDQVSASGTVIVSAGRGRKPKTSGSKIKNSLGFDELDKSISQEKENLEEGNIDFENDLSVIVVSMNTQADKNFGIKNKKLKDSSKSPAPAVIVKSDQVRIIARKDIKFMVKASETTPDEEAAMFVVRANGDIVFIPSAKGIIKLGGDDANKAVLCTTAGAVNIDGTVSANPIIDTMGGAQGGSDGLNGTFAKKVMMT